MLKDVNWSEDRTYRTEGKNKPLHFYLNGLCNSTRLDLLLGYFSSSAIHLLSLGFAKFLYSGGTMRMVINNVLSKGDKELITVAKEASASDDLIDLRDIKAIQKTLDVYDRHFFECIAWLIRNDKIQIQIIKPIGDTGIAHYKSGIFSDGTDQVYFTGSCNFTSYGLSQNLEHLSCFLSWEEVVRKRLENQQEEFETIFSGKADFAEYLDVSQVQAAIVDSFGDKTLKELLVQEKELIERKKELFEDREVKKLYKELTKQIEIIESTPHFPSNGKPRPYQVEAYDRWIANGYKGIFAMATGTGKTITSLNCLLNEYNKSTEKIYHALILVPTITLVEQWEKEAKLFNFQEIIKISSKYRWEGELATTLSIAKRIPTSFIIIATYASFTKNRFNKYVSDFPSDTLLIADEAHNLGSPTVLDKLPNITLAKRIGLSATPKRIYDLEGSAAMESFFNDKEPYTYSFSMERAIGEGILCKYYYYPHIVTLTPNELEEYIEITKKLAKFYNQNSTLDESNEILQNLLLKRKRIIHKATNKLTITKQILEKQFHETSSLKYTFIYVPEGNTPEIDEEESESNETIKIINQYTREVGRISNSIRVNQFVSGMADRNEVLNQFKEGKIHVIASMKCLDEGVDIPRAEFAIFCSSTGNPRQFIQRRGRILRTHPKKDIAVIHDLVVLPDLAMSTANSDTFRTERSLTEKELERVMYFSSLSINPFETERVFKKVCEHFDLNIYTIYNNLKSND